MALGTATPLLEGSERGIGRAAVRGSIVGFVIICVFVTAVGMYAGVPLGGAIAMGVFAGLFGGPGFGGMLGAVAFATRQEKAAARIRRAGRVEPLGDRAGARVDG
jgi:hypothetical protein